MTFRQKITVYFALLAGLLAVLACNLPWVVNYSPEYKVAVQQTLLATLFPKSAASTQSTTEPGVQTLSAQPSEILPTPPADFIKPGQPSVPDKGQKKFYYQIQSGDTLNAIEKRFNIPPEQLISPFSLPKDAFLPAGSTLIIPDTLNLNFYPAALLPDSEVLYTSSALDFDLETLIKSKNGYLNTYKMQVDDEWLDGAGVIRRVAIETSINPRLLLAVLEFRSHWLTGFPSTSEQVDYPIGFQAPENRGLYKQLSLVARYLTIGYYGWRSGEFLLLTFPDKTTTHCSPGLNAGSIALQNLFAQLYNQKEWKLTLYGPNGFNTFYPGLFGDAWLRANKVGLIFPPDITPPNLVLPFAVGESWSLTGGPHLAWGVGSPLGAIDFAPIIAGLQCKEAPSWVTASTSGLVVRSGNGVVAVDLDGDGHEQTGWIVLYLHIATHERIALGKTVKVNDPIGHPSCEGGGSSGTHVHLTRKYNGEWIAVDGPLPLSLSGWLVHPGGQAYQGTLTKGGKTVTAHGDGSGGSMITR